MAKSKKKNAEFEKLSKLIEKNPNDFQNYYDRAQVCFTTDPTEKDKIAQSLSDLNKCIELNPNFADAYNSRDCIYFHDLKDYEKAIADDTKMIELEEREYPHASRDAYWERADCYSFLKNYEKAVADYTKAIEIHLLDDEELKSELGEDEYFVGDEYFEIHLGRGNAYLNLKEYEKAILDFDKIIELNRADYVDEAHYKRGLAYKALGQIEKAEEDFEQAGGYYEEDDDENLNENISDYDNKNLNSDDINELVKLYEQKKDYSHIVYGYVYGFGKNKFGKNYDLAFKYVEIALNSKIENWLKELTINHIFSIFDDKNYNEKISTNLLKLIDKYGSAYSKNKLATMYRDGIGVEKNPEKAIKYFEKINNYHSIGEMYRDGKGVEKNSEEVIKYFEKAKSYQQIGIMYRDGKGIEKNFEKAVEYFKKDIAMGRKSCIKTLTTMLKKGQCTEKDLEDAIKIF